MPSYHFYTLVVILDIAYFVGRTYHRLNNNLLLLSLWNVRSNAQSSVEGDPVVTRILHQ